MKRRMATVWYDDESGEVCDVAFTQQFLGESELMRADVLKDVVNEMRAAYDTAHEAAFPPEIWAPKGVM